MLIISDNKTYIIKEGESIHEETPENLIPFIECKTSEGHLEGRIVPSYITKNGSSERRPCENAMVKVKTCKCSFGEINTNCNSKEYVYDLTIGRFTIERLLCYKIVGDSHVGYDYYYDIFVKIDKNPTVYSTPYISKFFTIIVPLVNKDLNSGLKSSEINWHKYDYILEDIYINNIGDVDIEKHIQNETITDFFEALHNVKIELDPSSEDSINIYLNYGFYNSYVISFLTETLKSKVYIKKRGKNLIYKVQKKAYDIQDEISLSRKIREVFFSEIKYRLVMTFLLNIDESEFRLGYLDESKFKTKRKITKNKEMFFLFNKLEKILVYLYYEGETRVGRDDITWFKTTYILPIEDNIRLPDYVIETFNNKDIYLNYEEEKYRYFYSIIRDRENNDTYFGRSGGEIDNSSILLSIYRDLMEYFEEKESNSPNITVKI